MARDSDAIEPTRGEVAAFCAALSWTLDALEAAARVAKPEEVQGLRLAYRLINNETKRRGFQRDAKRD